MDKYEYIVNLAEKTAKRVSQNRESWMKFLTSAARIYKYPFKEQLLIYAQNPDATACASIEIWNKRMNCWVNKGSSGIALPDDTATYGHKLKYVFDVSNVHAVEPNGRYPKAWKLREEHKSDVLHKLEQIYGSTDSTKPFEERIIEISDQLAADAYTELQIDYPDLQDRIGFDKLSEQDFALCLKKLISESVSFTILSACGIEISDHEFSFDYINQFVSIKTLSVLGTKINDSARGVLAEIGKTVRIYDKLREKEQEKEIYKDSSTNKKDKKKIKDLKAQIKDLSKYKEDEAAFEKEKEKYYEEVVFSDQAPDIQQYKTYYESIDPENAEVLYKQVVEQITYDSQVEDYAKTYSNMKPQEAASIFDTMTDNLGLVADILMNMGTQQRADILGKMDATTAAKLTEIMEPSKKK